MRTVPLTFALLLFLPAGLAAADPVEVVHGDLGEKLDKAVREFSGVFSGSVLCARGGAVYLAKGYGLADRAKGTPNTTYTLFDIGSVAKQHTAAAILWLADRGLLSVTDPIEKHLDGVPEDKKGITIHEMLTHTSGLARGMDSSKIRDELHTDREAFLKAALGEPLESKPGEKFAYNNMAYMVLAAIVERVSGEEFGPFLERRLFHPLLLTSTGYCGDPALDPKLAALRYPDGTTKTPQGSAIEYSFSWLNRGATSIVTNVWDLYGWSRAVLSDVVLSREAMKVWTWPVMDDYACGWMRKPGVGGRAKISHGGDTRGFHTMYTIYPEEDAVVVLLANTPIPREKYEIAGKLEEILLSGPAPPAGEPLPAEGRYMVSGDSTLELTRRGGAFRLLARGQEAVERLLAGAAFEDGRAPELGKLTAKAEKLLKPLVRGRRKACSTEFAEGGPARSAEAFLERWQTAGEELGRAKSVAPVGTVDLGDGPVTFVESVHPKGSAYWRIAWRDGEPVSAAYAGLEHPVGVWVGAAGEGVFAGRSLLGKPLTATAKERRGKVFSLVWEEVEGQPGKRGEFRRERD